MTKQDKLKKELINSDYSIYIAAAPSGFGKTTILRKLFQEFEAEQHGYIWYDMSMEDNHAEHFRNRMIEKFNQMENHYAVIFDGCEKIHNQEVWGILEDFAKKKEVTGFKNNTFKNNTFKNNTFKHNTFKLILITNGVIPTFLSKEIIYGKAVLWDKEYFRQDEGEYAAYFGGWSAGCAYAEHSHEAGEALLQDPVFTEYLSKEVFYKDRNEHILEFLAECAVLKHFTWKECEEILRSSEKDDLRNMMQECALLQLFPKPEKDKQGIDRYHYSEFFSNFLCLYCSNKRRLEIYKNAAEYYLKKASENSDLDHIENAVVYSISSNDPEIVKKCIKGYGGELIREGHYDLLQKVAEYVEVNREKMDAESLGVIAQYYYTQKQTDKLEQCLNRADSMYGKENQYTAYRAIYKAIQHMKTDQEKYSVILSDALFFLKEHQGELPYLMKQDRKLVEQYMGHEEAPVKKHLLIKCIGDFEAQIESEPKQLSWRTKKCAELMAYMADQEGRQLDRKELLEALWQEIPDNAVAMLHNMIYSIRKELSVYHMEELIQYKNKKYTLDMSCIDSEKKYFTDLENIIRKTAAAQNGAASYITEERLSQSDRKVLNEALKHITGRYLENIDAVWADEKRSAYEKLTMQAFRMAARHDVMLGEYRNAQENYQNALKIDPYSEEIMEELLKCMQKQGEWNGMKKKFEQFSTRMKNDLGIMPRHTFTAICTYHNETAQ